MTDNNGRYVRTCGRSKITCKSYPNDCRGCNDYKYMPMEWAGATTIDENTYKNQNVKEPQPMECANARVIVGNRAYPAKYVNYESSPFEYPEIEVTAILDPSRSTTISTAFKPLTITNVIFNPPATIVFWSDKTKTVVKCDESQECYDPEKGLAMAISKKMMGDNKYEYYNTFLHWLKKWHKQHGPKSIDDYFVPGGWDGDFATG